jgi:hypothetical protein
LTLPSYRSIPQNSVYSDATNHGSHDEIFSQTPDFSEFKDPWESYYPQNDPLTIDNVASDNKNENCCCKTEHESESKVSSQSEHNQQFHYSQSYSEQQPSFASVQTHNQQQYVMHNEYNQPREQATFYSGENHSPSVQHTQQHHGQQSNEQRHDKQYEYEQYNEKIHQHYYEQIYHHHHHHHHHEEHNKQHNEQHQHLQIQQHDYHKDQTNNHYTHHQPAHEHYIESYSDHPEVRHEDHANDVSDNNRTSHQNANCLHHAISQSSHIKSDEQILEAANTDIRKIDPSLPLPIPCTDLHNVAMRSDPNVMGTSRSEHLDSANVSNCSHIFLSFFEFVHIIILDAVTLENIIFASFYQKTEIHYQNIY